MELKETCATCPPPRTRDVWNVSSSCLFPDQLVKRWQTLFVGSADRQTTQRNLLEECSDLCLLSGEKITQLSTTDNKHIFSFYRNNNNSNIVDNVQWRNVLFSWWIKYCVDCLCYFRLQGQYVIASCAEGALHVWSWETIIEIGHISAHKQRINHCSLLTDTGESICARFLFLLTLTLFLKSWLCFKTRTKKSTQKKWLFSLHLMTAQCSSGNHYRSVSK